MSKRPQRPSHLLNMQEQFSPETCYDFDKGLELFDIWLEARQNETIEKPAKQKKQATVQEPRYKNLRDLLGLDDHQADYVPTPEENDLVEQVLSGDLDYDALSGLSDGATITELLNRMRPEPPTT